MVGFGHQAYNNMYTPRTFFFTESSGYDFYHHSYYMYVYTAVFVTPRFWFCSFPFVLQIVVLDGPVGAQTDHVEFNLQSAIVETVEEAQQRGGGATSFQTQRKHAFRLVVNAEEACSSPTAAAAAAAGQVKPPKLSPPSSNVSSTASLLGATASGGGGGGPSKLARCGSLTPDEETDVPVVVTTDASASATEVAEGGGGKAREARTGSSNHILWSPGSRRGSGTMEALPTDKGCCGGGPRVPRQVWVLAATNAKVSEGTSERASECERQREWCRFCRRRRPRRRHRRRRNLFLVAASSFFCSFGCGPPSTAYIYIYIPRFVFTGSVFTFYRVLVLWS